MPVAEQSKIFVNFTGGLNTESTPLNFPENAAVEIDNFDIQRTGEIKRRLGVDFEDNFVLSTDLFTENTFTTAGVSSHEWTAVNGKGELNFLVVQVGLKLFIHDLGNEPVSGTLLGTVDLEPLRTGSSAETFLIEASFGEGRMVIASRQLEPAYIEWDEDTSTFSLNDIVLRIRDFDGVDDGIENPGDRPATLTAEHHYNLLNQGWPTTILSANTSEGKGVPTNRDPIAFFFEDTGAYPSNADIIHLGKLGAAEDPAPLGAFHPSAIEKLILGNSPASRGHFILNPFNRDRSVVTVGTGQPSPYIEIPFSRGRTIKFPIASVDIDFSSLVQPSTPERPTATEFYANRVWFAGVGDKENAGDIFFSQLLTDMSVAGNCFQSQDPTAEDFNSLLDTDGGVIHIADMGRVHKLLVVGQDLVVVAVNGIWAISGATGANFVATDFTVRKITDVGTLSAESVLAADAALYWWNGGGIYRMTGSQIDDELIVERISKDTIQTFYDEIPEAGRSYARGFYDEFQKKLYWFYNDTSAYDGINFRFDYNRSLVLDLTINAFYPYTYSSIASNSPLIAAMTAKEPGTESIVTFDIVLTGDDIVLGGDDIVQDVAFPTFADAKLKMLTFTRNVNDTTLFEYTFSEFLGTTFNDWVLQDLRVTAPDATGADYSSIVQVAWQDFGDPLPLKKITHVTSYFNRTETGYTLVDGNIVFDSPSGGTLQTRWEWTDQDVGRWTKVETAYRLLRFYIPADENDPFDYGFTVVKTKLRMRGKGHAFGLRYESEAGKDMQLIGFGVNLRAGTKL